MSLWHKHVSVITFDDIDRFCRTMQPEGMRLDYKVERPKDLEKLIAAFANTLGGLIILGVESHKTTNEPIWPPERGMETKPGIDEAITAIARDAIYPPVRISVSPIIENKLLPGSCLAIVRVDESKDAPHAVDGGRKVYERTGSTNKPHNFLLAGIDRIEYLLNRRRRIEEERESILSRALARSRRLVSESLKPIVWVSVMPLYPWREICKPSTCYNHFRFSNFPTQFVQRIPDGGLFASEINIESLGLTTTHVISCDSLGHFLYVRGLVHFMRRIDGPFVIYPVEEIRNCEFVYESVKKRIIDMIDEARRFYKKPEVERPGLLSLTIGMSQTANMRMIAFNDNFSSKRFLDDQYHHNLILSVEDFLSPHGTVDAIFDRIAFAFDVSTPDGL